MFTRLAIFTALVLPTLAAATPVARASCDTGSIQCCQSTESASSASGTALLKSIGVVVTDPDVLLGLTCSPISVIGVGSGTACDASPVCCENNSFGSLVSIGCVPVSI
ncbi:hydrophobin [Cytidiella melzeri]|nr:hydrophobin [Cytidiella melzeri]